MRQRPGITLAISDPVCAFSGITRKVTQHATRDVYAFVPDLPLNQPWTDEKLYQRYGLTAEEIAFIESQVVLMQMLVDEVASDDAIDE
jgi:site-specific DNA-methyltransferase (adenine-specific)